MPVSVTHHLLSMQLWPELDTTLPYDAFLFFFPLPRLLYSGEEEEGGVFDGPFPS